MERTKTQATLTLKCSFSTRNCMSNKSWNDYEMVTVFILFISNFIVHDIIKTQHYIFRVGQMEEVLLNYSQHKAIISYIKSCCKISLAYFTSWLTNACLLLYTRTALQPTSQHQCNTYKKPFTADNNKLHCSLLILYNYCCNLTLWICPYFHNFPESECQHFN